jgi:hypothetical protein
MVDSCQEQAVCFFSTAFTQSAIKCQVIKLTIHFHRMLSLKISGAIFLPPPCRCPDGMHGDNCTFTFECSSKITDGPKVDIQCIVYNIYYTLYIYIL